MRRSTTTAIFGRYVDMIGDEVWGLKTLRVTVCFIFIAKLNLVIITTNVYHVGHILVDF